MSTRTSCICGGAMCIDAFSEHFNALQCLRCGTTNFVSKLGTSALNFEYAQHNEKYAQIDYLYGSVLRWSHHRLMRRNWAGRKVLEIGCFNGFFLAKLRNLGAEVYGFDLNPMALAAGRKLFGLETTDISLESLEVHGPFDDIVCVDVIEHVDEPEGLLVQLRRMLRPGGRLFVAGPTSERRMHDKSDYPPHHKWWFTRRGLADFLQGNGFKVSRIDIQRDAVLLVRNLLGKIAHGFNRKEYYGDSAVAAPSISNPIVSRIYSLATALGIGLFTLLRVSYCSTLIELERTG